MDSSNKTKTKDQTDSCRRFKSKNTENAKERNFHKERQKVKQLDSSKKTKTKDQTDSCRRFKSRNTENAKERNFHKERQKVKQLDSSKKTKTKDQTDSCRRFKSRNTENAKKRKRLSRSQETLSQTDPLMPIKLAHDTKRNTTVDKKQLKEKSVHEERQKVKQLDSSKKTKTKDQTHSSRNFKKRNKENAKERKRLSRSQQTLSQTDPLMANKLAHNTKKQPKEKYVYGKKNTKEKCSRLYTEAKSKIINNYNEYFKCTQMTNLRRKRKLLERLKRSNMLKKKYLSEKQKRLTECLKVFNEKTLHGPIYTCTVCLQTWFRSSVVDVAKTNWKSHLSQKLFLECTQHYKSVESKEWLCNTCKRSIKEGHWPKLSVINGMGFPNIPDELKLYPMEVRIVSPRLLFFQMRSHFLGKRTRAIGHVVNIAVDVAPTVKMLPRSLSDTHTITIKYKRKFEYKKM